MSTLPTIDRRHGSRPRFLSLFVLAAALSACAGAGTMRDADRAHVYRSGEDFVRLDPVEPGAPPNAHPIVLSVAQVRDLLTPLKVSHADSIGKASVFTNDELDRLVPPLVSALSRAHTDQDVTFAVTSYRGILGKLSPKSITTGRLFASGDTINLIFGVMQLRLESEKVEPATVVPPTIAPGTRSRKIDTTAWKLDPIGGYFHDRRSDWVVFDRAALGPAAAPVLPTKDGTTPDGRAQEVEKRLEVLDKLRKTGAITEEEYRERRRAILDQL